MGVHFKIKFGNRTEAADGINRTALREIKLLKELKHTHILGVRWFLFGMKISSPMNIDFKLLDVFGHGSNINLVYDYMLTDLEEIIKDRENVVLTPSHIKAYMIMILLGLEYLHSNWILHRVSMREQYCTIL